jgi:glycosidase
MNYPLKNAILNFVKYGDEKGLSWTIKEQIDHYPKFVLDNVMNILSTHDTARLITVLSGLDMNGKSKDEMAKTFIPSDMLNIAKNKVKIASLLQYTLCGVPSLYYGDEIGMQGYIDPLNRKCYPWENQDQELLKWYRFLGKLREDYSAFKHGDFAEIYADKGAYIFKRFCKDNEVLIAVNCGRETIGLEFNDKLFNLIEEKEYVKEFALYPNMFAVLIKIKK